MSESRTAPEPIILETSQPDLVLVQMLTQEDDKAYFELQNSNIDYWKEFGNAIDENEEAVTGRRLEHGNGRFGIWHEYNLIGIVGYSTKSSISDAEIGVLLDQHSAGHGKATLAIKSLTDYALHHFNRVFAEVDPGNSKSIGLLQRAGFQTNGEVVTRDWGEALVFEAQG